MNLPYHSARLEGKIARSLYRAALLMILRKRVRVTRELPFDVFSYSGESTLPEQVASIRSFLTPAGRPKQFTVVSDGSYINPSIELLERIDNCVRVQRTAPNLPPRLPTKVQSYLTSHFTGKQLALFMSLPAHGPTLYTDSDVLFFPEAIELADLARTKSVPAFYLADYQFSADERLIRDRAEKENPVNMGFLLLFQNLDWARPGFGLNCPSNGQKPGTRSTNSVSATPFRRRRVRALSRRGGTPSFHIERHVTFGATPENLMSSIV